VRVEYLSRQLGLNDKSHYKTVDNLIRVSGTAGILESTKSIAVEGCGLSLSWQSGHALTIEHGHDERIRAQGRGSVHGVGSFMVGCCVPDWDTSNVVQNTARLPGLFRAEQSLRLPTRSR
jgi:hypothetical protein